MMLEKALEDITNILRNIGQEKVMTDHEVKVTKLNLIPCNCGVGFDLSRDHAPSCERSEK